MELPLTTVLITTRTIGLDVGGLGAGGVADGGDTSLFSVVPRRLVLASRIPHQQFLLEDRKERSSSAGTLLAPIPCLISHIGVYTAAL